MASLMMPALLTSTSSRPNSSITWPTAASAPAHVDTSSALTTAVPPPALISPATALACSASTSLTTRRAPSAARSSASPRPMPRPAPVTMADLPSSDPI